MKNSIKTVMGLAVIILIVAVVFVSKNKQNEGNKVIKIGVMAPLTGVAASLGEWAVQGTHLAEAEINKSGKRVELVIEDDACDGAKAVTAYQKLRDVDQVNYIVGPLCAAASVPVSDIAKNTSVVLVRTGLTSTNLIDVGDHMFNILPTVSSVADSALSFVQKELKSTKVSILYATDEYGVDNNNSLVAFAKENNIQVISDEGYDKLVNDVRTQVLKFKNDKSETVIVAGYTPGYIAFLKQAKELGLNKQIVAVSNLQDPKIAEANAQLGTKIYYPYPTKSDLDSVVSFVSKYKLAYPTDAKFLPMYIGSGYDALNILVSSIGKCKKADDVKCVRQKLLETQNYHGANGLISLDAKGNNINQSGIEMRVLNGSEFSKY